MRKALRSATVTIYSSPDEQNHGVMNCKVYISLSSRTMLNSIFSILFSSAYLPLQKTGLYVVLISTAASKDHYLITPIAYTMKVATYYFL